MMCYYLNVHFQGQRVNDILEELLPCIYLYTVAYEDLEDP